MVNKLLLLIKLYYKNFLLYFVAGGFCALIDWTAFYILYYKFNIHYLSAGAIAFILAASINYVLSCFVFKASKFKAFTIYVLILLASSVALCIDLSAMFVVIHFFDVNEMLGKIFGTGVAFIFNFAFRQFFIFSTKAS